MIAFKYVHPTKFRMKSPLRYPGGKTRACASLQGICIEHFGVPATLYSPFLGGGSFELHMKTKHSCKIVASDGFHPLISFWQQVQTNKEALHSYVSTNLKPLSKERFYAIRDSIMDERDTLKQAACYFALNRCSFSGATLSGGFSAEAERTRFNSSAIDRLKSMDLADFEIAHASFLDFFDQIYVDPGPNDVLFLDPPYLVDSKLYGMKGDMHSGFEHDALATVLRTKKRWMLCYNDCERIRNLYADYKIIEVGWSYGMNKSKKSSEIVIVSI
jgi:DNA adenine methylase